MLQIRDMRAEDKGQVMPLVVKFYKSDAVDHDVPVSLLERTFDDAISKDPILRGITLLEDDQIIGYAYLTQYYACETGGRTLMMEELYLTNACRGKGYGSQFFRWVFEEYPEVARFRLEVTEANQAAVKLYQRLGFQMLDYRQMVIDRM